MEQETEAFEVIVGTGIRESKELAIAEASKLLSEVYQYQNGDTFDINVYGGDGETFAVGLCFNTDIQVGDDFGLRTVMEEFTDHRSVESVERVNFVPV